jgi:hypothetical protein
LWIYVNTPTAASARGEASTKEFVPQFVPSFDPSLSQC